MIYFCGIISEKVAIKILDKTKLDQKTQRLLSREISSMEKLHHPNIIRLYEVVETLAKLHIVMEYAGGGELFTKISNEGRLPEVDAKFLFAQIVAAVRHMVSCLDTECNLCQYIYIRHGVILIPIPHKMFQFQFHFYQLFTYYFLA